MTKIDVRSTANLPKYICNDCIKTLQDISLFIDISKHNAASLGKNVLLKNENEHVGTAECGTSQNHVIKCEEYKEDLQYFKGFEICRICYSTNILNPVEGKAHLMQVFQNITNIHVKSEGISNRNNICNKCIKKLETISLFISVSLYNEMKLKNNTIGENEALETENYLEGNAKDMGYCNKVKQDEFDKNAHSYESNGLHTIIDIKEEIVDNHEASIERIYRNGLNIFSDNHFQKNSFDYPSKAEFNSVIHLKNQFKPLDTNLIEKSFIQKGHLPEHILIHAGEKPFKCDCCEKKFTLKSNLQKHMFIHPGEKPFKCDDNCGKSFTLKRLLQKHKLIHSEEKPFKCDRCQKMFTVKFRLQRHKLIHSKEKPFKCYWCGKSFTLKSSLRTHILIHSGKKPFKCDDCKKSFTQMGHLQQHKLTHSGEKLFNCDCCERSFTQKRLLQKHKLIHSEEKPFKCDRCQKMFTVKSHLQRHKLIHSGEKPFKCYCCGKSFTHKSTLQRHILIHSVEKSFKCDCCEMSFTRKWHLRKHMLIHSGEKPFKCDSCEKRFTQKWNLQKHMVVHSGK